MDTINKYGIANNKEERNLVLKFQIQKNVKNPKCKSRRRTIYKLNSPERFRSYTMEDKYFHLGEKIKLPEGIRACMVTLPTLSNIELKRKQGNINIMMRQWFTFILLITVITAQKWSFPLRIFSVNVTKSSVSCGFGHIHWRNPSWKTLFFVQWMKRRLLSPKE